MRYPDFDKYDFAFPPKGSSVVEVVKGEIAINHFLRRNEGYFPIVKLQFFFREERKTIKVYQRPDFQIKEVYHWQNSPVGDEYQQILEGTYPTFFWGSIVQAYMVKKEWAGQEVFLKELIPDSHCFTYLGNRQGVRAIFDGKDIKLLDPPSKPHYHLKP